MLKKLLSVLMAFAIMICGVNGVWADKIEAVSTVTAKSKVVPKFTEKSIKRDNIDKDYIVVTTSDKSVHDLEKEYKSSEESTCEERLSEENTISLNMTGKEANDLQKRKDVLLVEEDISVNACSRNEYRKKIFRKIRTKGKNKREWNIQAIKADTVEKESENETQDQKKVKVAVLDSGIDYDNDIIITDSINLVPGEEEMSPFFMDDTGHGTSVAGIIAAEDNDEGITGINDKIELYSARVLHDDTAPVSRVVEGIYWAIDKRVNIINISFSTPEDSQLLKKAINDAYKAGILIVAAAGNDENVEYPAAYEEVVAVGAVDCEGNKSADSAGGDELELVAPGEKVKSSALLGGSVVVSGTSLSAPHVVGVASLLWEKDLSVSNEFIRNLLNASANGYGDKENYGNGLIDYEYALEIYDEFKAEYKDVVTTAGVETGSVEAGYTDIPENKSPLIVFKENNYVEGKWADHAKTASWYTDVKNFQYGAREPDSNAGLKGLNNNHAWHGGRFCNYVAIYRYLNKVARAVNDLGESASIASIRSKIKSVGAVDGMNVCQYGNLKPTAQAKYAGGVYEGLKSDLCTYIAPILYGKTKRQKEAFVFGLASHGATDAYAHSSYRYNGYKWNYIKHEQKIVNGEKVPDPDHKLYTDRTDCVPRRFESAKAVLKNIVSRFNNERSSVNIIRDFAIDSPYTEGTRRKYYNTYLTKYTLDNRNTDATYRLYYFVDYMLYAGESDGFMLNMYSLASEYPVDIFK